jgi:hypothetical protein
MASELRKEFGQFDQLHEIDSHLYEVATSWIAARGMEN